ncbi:MAG: hypothetical protein ACI8RC_003187 [Ilumatobacter sp.]|jgi:hypothetical protein
MGAPMPKSTLSFMSETVELQASNNVAMHW